MKSNKSKLFSWNYIFGSFQLFLSSKIEFWPFLKLEKMEFGQKTIREFDLFYFTNLFVLDFFKMFLAHCVRKTQPVLVPRSNNTPINYYFYLFPNYRSLSRNARHSWRDYWRGKPGHPRGYAGSLSRISERKLRVRKAVWFIVSYCDR